MPPVNPEILVWARETAGLTLEDAAQKLGLRDTQNISASDRLNQYERGENDPSRPMILKMVKHYRRPLLTFYMSQPPRQGNRGTDFRTLPEHFSESDEALLDALIRNVKARQSLVKSALEDEDDVEPLTFVASSRRSDGFQNIARSIQEVLDFDIQDYRRESGINNAFNYLRAKTENAGIFVLLIGNLGSHHTAIDVEVFRGFTISDELAPFIIINDQDSHAAWSFTLLHELAHLWLGHTGVSGASFEQGIERFCNDVASEILLPTNELHELTVTRQTDFTTLKELISSFAEFKNVSSSMVAYKLMTNNIISRDSWRQLSYFFRTTWLQNRENNRRQTGNSGGPNYYTVRKHRLGPTLTSVIGRMMQLGSVTTTQAGMVLGVKPSNVHKLIGVN